MNKWYLTRPQPSSSNDLDFTFPQKHRTASSNSDAYYSSKVYWNEGEVVQLKQWLWDYFNATPPPTTIHSLSIINHRRSCIIRYSPWWEHLGSLLFALLNAVISPALFSLSVCGHCNEHFNFQLFYMVYCLKLSGAKWGHKGRGILSISLLCFVNVFNLGAVSVLRTISS